VKGPFKKEYLASRKENEVATAYGSPVSLGKNDIRKKRASLANNREHSPIGMGEESGISQVPILASKIGAGGCVEDQEG